MTKQTTFELIDNYPDNGTEALIDTLPGHKIVKIIDNFVAGHGKPGPAIMLDDGRILQLVEAEECCAWFTANINNIDLDDNIITRIEEEYPSNRCRDLSYLQVTLHVLTRDKKIADINVFGDETSGYYCHDITLNVWKESRKENRHDRGR